MELHEANQSKPDEYLWERNILLRNYQIHLLEIAKKQNSIIYLPTGTGKTLIAIHVLLSRTEEIQRPFNEGGKRVFFICNTKIMVYQLAKVVETQTKFKVAYLTGDMNVDKWNGSQWRKLFEKKHVFILTGEILKMILQLNFISPSQISVLVLDECHHAMHDHPYRLVMNAINACNPDEAPLIVGLSSVLLNITPKIRQIPQSIKGLETSMNARVITEIQLREVMSFSANPVDKLLTYEKDPSTPLIDYVLQMLDKVIDTFKRITVNSCESTIPSEGKVFKKKNKARRIKNSFAQAKMLFEELGVFGGCLGLLYFIIFFEKLRLLSVDALEIQLLLYANTELLKLRRAILSYTGEDESVDSIICFSSRKVQKLMHAIKEAHATNNGNHVSILIFVRQRVTAVVLSFLLKILKGAGSEFGFLKPEFIVGTTNFSKDSLIVDYKSEEIVRKFSCHSINVLVSTNMLEEGIDVSACNVVISFDFPLGYPNYFQSRGRARGKESTYFIFAENSDVSKKMECINHFKKIEDEIFRTICHEDQSSENIDTPDDVVQKIQLPGLFGTISLDGSAAIKVVQRYCSKLPQDRYSFLSPLYWYLVEGSKKKGFVQLPMNCPLREVIEGECMCTIKAAKKSSFLRTVKKLYDMGELDHELNPRSLETREEDFDYLFPHYKAEKIDKSLPQPGTKKREQKYKIKFAESLSSCLPRPGIKVFLHVIKFNVTFEKPPIERKVIIYETLQFPGTFALLSSKKLWKICRFPLFLDMGQIDCDLLVNYDELVLTESEINDIKECHFSLFKKVNRVVKNSQIFDNRNKENSFFVVPVEMNEENRFVLNWDLIRCDYCKNSTSALVRYNPYVRKQIKRTPESYQKNGAEFSSSNALLPMDAIKGRLLWEVSEDGGTGTKFYMTETDYKYFVIIPTYRNQVYPQLYIVNKICRDMSPLSPFPRVDYKDYVSYYKDNYMVDITNMTQPLLRVSPIYACSNFNRPRNRKLGRERNKIYEEHLVPELCDVIPFDKRYFLKALFLPTVLNRICHIYCVEEFRRKVVSETGLGVCELPQGSEWPPLQVDHTEGDDQNKDLIKSCDFKNIQSTFLLTKLKDTRSQVNTETMLDPERRLYEVGLCDLEFTVRNLKETSLEESEKANALNGCDEVIKLCAMRDTFIPPLSNLKGGSNSTLGPHLAQLIQASTSSSANDAFDYERLEILGDAFLKFATTLFLFRNFTVDEGVLTMMKGKIVGNRNLMYCALAKGFPDIISVDEFVPSCDYNPPLFCIPERLVEGIVSRNLEPAVIYRLAFTFEEQFSGDLSEETFQKNEEIFEEYEKCYETATSPLLQHKIINDKTVSDCVEAFIGAYLLASGMRGAFDFLTWMQVLPRPNNYSELLEKPYCQPQKPKKQVVVMTLLNQVFYVELEDTINYCFNNKALLLEAITHASYSKNRVTNCYQRLEFLGDAILDFLITSYIYEYCGNLGPGAVTDIRSSLVNNLTFACLTVRYELHKYLLSFSPSLTRAINTFVTFQKSRNHVVDDNVAILLEENEYVMAETIAVPKALGDLFEALAGAIYLDSGNSLEAVWKVFYVMMKREIDLFTKTVPKTPIRLLHEICGDKPEFKSEVVSHGLVMVSCLFYYNNEEIKTYGFGCNKKDAKRSAVKVALNEILTLKK